MSKEKPFPKTKQFFLFNSNEIAQWLTHHGFNSETIDIITNNSITGYDLVTFAEEDFKQLNIPIQHEYYLLLQKIQESVFNELKIHVSYEGKTYVFEVDNDPSYSVEALSLAVADVFQLQGKVYLKTQDNDILVPNIRIVQRLIINPKKYEKLMVVNFQVSPPKQEIGYSSAVNYSNYKIANDMVPLIPKNTSKFDVEYNSKQLLDPFQYQPLSNKDIRYNLLQNPEEMNQNKNEIEYSNRNQGMNNADYESYDANPGDKEKDNPYVFVPMDKGNKLKQDAQFKQNNKTREEQLQSGNYSAKDIKSKKNMTLQPGNKEDIDNYKRVYGNYDRAELNIEDNNEDTHRLIQEKDEIKRISSEKRNYRLNLQNENKLDDYQPKQYDKYSSGAGNYTSVDKISRYSSRQPGYQSGMLYKDKESPNEPGYPATAFQNKLIVSQKETDEQGFNTTFDLRNKVNNLRSQINNYPRTNKTSNEGPSHDLMQKFPEYKNRNQNYQKQEKKRDYFA